MKNSESRRDSAKAAQEEREFLQGPRPRGSELVRAIRIFLEFIYAFRKLSFVGPCVTVFGSARFKEDHPYYQLGLQTGRALAEAGFTVMTGGGPGLMEAANRGAQEAGGRSVGCSIDLPVPQPMNDYLDTAVEFRHFFVRKVMLVKYSYAFIALPGGFGTFDEIFEAATLVQTRKIKDFPIVLLGTSFWTPLVDVLRNTLIPEGTIDHNDLGLLETTDSPEEAVRSIRHQALEHFGLSYGPRMKRRWYLGE
jgi:uncharacterized protein (TIGR00730 family)